jgi:formylglycine-generating enzyme required for sulfatase activity
VPTGRVPERNFAVLAFVIARYPITNAQYARFIEDMGYDEPRGWTKTGWELRVSEDWKQPRYWHDPDWNAPNHPVVGVSWYEAVAFCQWLKAASGEPIVLPTEQQWQRAAQGDDGRLNPWGNTWDASRCNNNVDGKGLGKTTPVRQYEGKGDSPFGVTDMAGNVWEWCRTAFMTGSQELEGTSSRVVRGGSWRGELPGSFRCDMRYWGPPTGRPNEWGFRIARLSEPLAD